MLLDSDDSLRLDDLECLGSTSSGATFATSSGDLIEIECFGDGAFRLRSGPNTRPDYGLLTGSPCACKADLSGTARWWFDSGDSVLQISGSPFAVKLLWRNELVLSSATDLRIDGSPRLPVLGRLRRGGLWSAAFALRSGEAVYGLGEKFGPLDKRGQLVHSQVAKATGVNTGISGRNAPFAWSPGVGAGAWGLFVHTPGMVTHAIGNPDWSHRSYAVMAQDEALDLFLFAAPDPAGILDHFTRVTGRPRLAPRWSLGVWVAAAPASGPGEAEALVARMRERRLPCDVVTFGAPGSGDTGNDFNWNPVHDADQAESIDRIKAHQVRVCLRETCTIAAGSPVYEDLASNGYLLLGLDGEPAELAPIDFTNADAFAWWRDAHRNWFEDGIDAFECVGGDDVSEDTGASNGDSGSRLHNVYPLLHQRCAFDASERFAPPESVPPVIASHAGWIGSQRFPVGFADAAQPDWEGLAASIRGALAWGMSGGACHGLSVGDHHGPHAPAPELYLRWLQAAVFASHIRLMVSPGCEPWSYGAEIEAVARKWLALRYRLIPYLEHSIAQAARTGQPVMRAMALEFPASSLLRGFDTQFMCGDALLVAPILREGGEVEIALPPGGWYDLNTRVRHAGPRVLRYVAAPDQFPVFGREGYALPLGRAAEHTRDADLVRPLEALWLFGAPRVRLDAHGQVRIEIDADGEAIVRAEEIEVTSFGSAEPVAVHPL